MSPTAFADAPRLPARLSPLRKFSRLLVLLWIGLVAAPALAQTSSVPLPTLSTPPAGTKGFPFQTSSIDLASFGYTEEEFLVSGTARAFVNSGPLGNDGIWNAVPGATAPYVTRMLVRKPASPARFNGTVVVEWINVSGGLDATPEWDLDHVELLRKGYAWVGVSAQYVGALFLPVFDSVRYASISHPGDSWSYDIFSQAGAAILSGNPQPLGQLRPRVRKLIAVGESQSAFRLFTYYNAIQPLAKIYQGFLIHSTGSGWALSQSYGGGGLGGAGYIPAPAGAPATPDITVPPTAFIRSDLPEPVLFLNTETDITFLGAGFSVHNQPDSNTFRMWEVAGTSHADAYLLKHAGADAAKSGLNVPPTDCGSPPINAGPQTFAVRTATRALARWTGAPKLAPSIAPRLSVQIVTSPQPAAVIERDAATGNAIGGIRLPQLAVPIATFSGSRPPLAIQSNPNCVLFGSSDAWDGDTDAWDGNASLDPSPTPEPSLAALYGTKNDYVHRYTAAAWQSLLQGFLLADDMSQVIGLAKAANVPDGTASNATVVPDP